MSLFRSILCHTVLLLHNAIPNVFETIHQDILIRRLFYSTRDSSLNIHQKILFLQWLLCFPASSGHIVHRREGREGREGRGGNGRKGTERGKRGSRGGKGASGGRKEEEEEEEEEEDEKREILVPASRHRSRFLLLHRHRHLFYPSVFEPLALREIKLQALLHCYAPYHASEQGRRRREPPHDLLMSLA